MKESDKNSDEELSKNDRFNKLMQDGVKPDYSNYQQAEFERRDANRQKTSGNFAGVGCSLIFIALVLTIYQMDW